VNVQRALAALGDGEPAVAVQACNEALVYKMDLDTRKAIERARDEADIGTIENAEFILNSLLDSILPKPRIGASLKTAELDHASGENGCAEDCQSCAAERPDLSHDANCAYRHKGECTCGKDSRPERMGKSRRKTGAQKLFEQDKAALYASKTPINRIAQIIMHEGKGAPNTANGQAFEAGQLNEILDNLRKSEAQQNDLISALEHGVALASFFEAHPAQNVKDLAAKFLPEMRAAIARAKG